MGSGGSVETEMDVSFLGALSGNDMSGATSTNTASVASAQEQNNAALALANNNQTADSSNSDGDEEYTGEATNGGQKSPAEIQNSDKDIAAAKDYLSGSKEMRAVITAFESGNFHIAINSQGDDRYDPDTRTVHWDPYKRGDLTNGGHQSPALILGHEMAHATENPQLNERLRNTRDSKYDNKEERRVILNYESPAARELGESTRSNHRGKLEWVPCPTCR
jgi:hypothetical protein